MALNKRAISHCFLFRHFPSCQFKANHYLGNCCFVQPSTVIVYRSVPLGYGLAVADWCNLLHGWVHRHLGLLFMHTYMASLWAQSLFQVVAKSQDERTVSKHGVTVSLCCYSPDFSIIQQHSFFFCIADVLYWSDFWVWYHSVRCFGSIVLHNTSWCIVRVFNRHVTEALSWSFGCAANSGEIWFVIKWVFRCVAFSLRGMCLDWEWQKAPPHVPCVCGWTSCFNVVNQVSLVIVIDECAVVVCHEIKWIWANCCTRIESLPCIGSWPCAYLAIGAICLL